MFCDFLWLVLCFVLCFGLVFLFLFDLSRSLQSLIWFFGLVFLLRRARYRKTNFFYALVILVSWSNIALFALLETNFLRDFIVILCFKLFKTYQITELLVTVSRLKNALNTVDLVIWYVIIVLRFFQNIVISITGILSCVLSC